MAFDSLTDLTTVTVTATYLDFLGNPMSGTVSFWPQQVVNAADGNVELAPTRIDQALDRHGTVTIELPVGDDPDYTPVFVYKVQEKLDGESTTNGSNTRREAFFISLTAADAGSDYDLTTAEHVVPVDDSQYAAFFFKTGGTITGDTEIDADLAVNGDIAGTGDLSVATLHVNGLPVTGVVTTPHSYAVGSSEALPSTKAGLDNSGGKLRVVNDLAGAANEIEIVATGAGPISAKVNGAEVQNISATGVTTTVAGHAVQQIASTGVTTSVGGTAVETVTSAGVAVTGTVTASGNIGTSGGIMATGAASVGSLSIGGVAPLMPIQVSQQGGLASLDGQGRVPAAQIPTTCQLGAYFNSYTLNDAVNIDVTTASISTLESDLATSLDFILMFGGVSPNGSFSSGQWAKVQAFLDAGRKVVINVALQGTLANVNAGQFDTAMSQLGAYALAYSQAHPAWKDRLIVKYMHEQNVSTGYPWCVFTSTNQSDAGGSTATAISNYITAFRRIAGVLRTAATGTDSACHVLTTHEMGAFNDNNTAENGFIPFETFYPGDAYVDIVSVNAYNRYGLSSGNSLWTSFEAAVRPMLEAYRRVAPSKPIMIGESSTNDAGMINSVTVTAGGTGYSAGTTLTATAPGSGATLSPVITSGAITSVTVAQRGRGYNDQTVLALGSTGGGTGATFTSAILVEKQSKAQWFKDAFTFIRDQSDIKYYSLFMTNLGSAGDYRYWAPNTTAEKSAITEGANYLRAKTKTNDGLTRRGRIGINLVDDPYCNDVSRWTAAGTNVGTMSRTTAQQNIASYDTAPGDNTGALRLTHNGTAGNAQDNRMYTIIGQNQTLANENFTLSFDARFKPSGTSGQAWLNAGMETNDGNAFFRKLQPGVPLDTAWKRYSVSTYATTASAGYRVCFAIGRSSIAGQFLVSNVKLEYGDHATPLLPVQRQLGRTTVADAAYSLVGGTTDELVAYTSLTAARTVTLPDATLMPRGRVVNVKDEAGTAGTNTLTIATTSSQLIDGASTKTITTNYGALRLYSNGANWFTI